MTDKKAKELLNQYYSEQPQDEIIESLIYLTNKSRGKHTTEYQLRRAYRNGTLTDTFKRLDPIAYNVAKSDLK